MIVTFSLLGVALAGMVVGCFEIDHLSLPKHHSNKQPRDSKTKRFVKKPTVFINDDWKESL